MSVYTSVQGVSKPPAINSARTNYLFYSEVQEGVVEYYAVRESVRPRKAQVAGHVLQLRQPRPIEYRDDEHPPQLSKIDRRVSIDQRYRFS